MNDSIKIASPTSAQELIQRNQLLAQTLRDRPLAWDYSSEYPLVLAPGTENTSHCIYQGSDIVAHANLWPRQLIHASGKQTFNLALIGNVATSEHHRGKGYQRQLIDHLAKTASLQGANALVLWSDLLEFYQNLGFSSNGRELRLDFCPRDRGGDTGITRTNAVTLSHQDLSDMLALRPRLEWTLQRSVDDFRVLLAIPDTHTFIRRKGTKIQSWCVIGKGSDMLGVIHEWGAASSAALLSDIQSILVKHQLDTLTLLAPSCLSASWLQVLKLEAQSYTEHPVALVRPLDGKGKDAANALARGFIWGLDSI